MASAEQRRDGGAKFAIAIGASTHAAARVALARATDAGADLAELRLDFLTEPIDLASLLAERRLPVIATYRPPREGGRCDLPDAERLRVLLRAAELGAEYVDVEWDTADPAMLGALRAAGAQVIVSRHAFDRMPGIAGWVTQIAETGADVVKVVGMAASSLDTLPVFRALREADQPTIAIAMGDAGLATRVLALRYQACLLTFAAADDAGGTAPGQITLGDMRDVYRAATIGPSTTSIGVIAPHVERGLIADLNRDLAALGADAVAVPFVSPVDPRALSRVLRGAPVAGWYVADPALRVQLLASVDERTPAAERAGLADAVVPVDGRLSGTWIGAPFDAVRHLLDR